MYLFIDSNIFLNFYHYSSEGLDQLSKIGGLIASGKIILQTPEQVCTEIERIREIKIKDALKTFESARFAEGVPRICHDYPEFNDMKEFLKQYVAKKKRLLERVKEDSWKRSLKADKIINDILSNARKINTADAVVQRASLRMKLGNPPGKKGSFGDAIIWEALLENVPRDKEIHFVSGDIDYRSPLDDDSLSQYLEKEWSEVKGTSIIFHKTISSFLRSKFPSIKFTEEDLVNFKIETLIDSGSFDESRKALARLRAIGDFTDEQINRIVKASVSNDQIYLAHKYSPEKVGSVLKDIISGREDDIDGDLLARFHDIYG